MNKFKVGDRVITRDGFSFDGKECEIISTTDHTSMVTCKSAYPNKEAFCVRNNMMFLVNTDRHELHITSDGTTTNAVYKLNAKVEKTAKAVCCASDTYNFNVGAELAINRVLYGTDFKPISADKIKSGTMPTMRDPYANQRCTNFVPKQEDKPKHEAVTLYCTKSCARMLTKGKLYIPSEVGHLVFDNGQTSCYKTTDKGFWTEWNSRLIKTEKRPALVGEYALAIHSDYGKTMPANEVYLVTRINSATGGCGLKCPTREESLYFLLNEYLVLPDYQPEKVEPVYYSGKVVCVSVTSSAMDRFWTVGKVYEFKNGQSRNNTGDITPMTRMPIKSLKELIEHYETGVKFIEYLGEQSC